MASRSRRASFALSAVLAIAVTSIGLAESPAVGKLLPLAVSKGRCECVLPTPQASEKYFLIIGSLNRDLTKRQIVLQTSATSEPSAILLQENNKKDEWANRVGEWSRRQEKSRQSKLPAREYPPVADPPARKIFHLLTKEGDLLDPRNYARVSADLQAVGRHCIVYADHETADQDKLKPTVEDAVRTFDAEVYPQARKRLGQALDVDRDGRFAILFTHRLNNLGSGGTKLDGFVRGSDFYRDLEAPLGNQCDMMYLSSDLKPGPYLRTLLAHEYTHAVVFSEHVFGDYLPDHAKSDEQAWLNEALAHVNEDQHAYSWSNLDYRINAFLSDPARYSLVVPDYYGAKLWRSPGHRGATYLFLSWCVEKYGLDVVRRLVQSNLSGVNNLEAATNETFDELFRQWSASLLTSGTNLAVEGVAPFRRFDLYKPLGCQYLAGPRVEQVDMANDKRTFTLAGTSVAYFLLHSPSGENTRLSITAEAGTDLQVSLVHLQADVGRLSADWENSEKQPRLVITAHDAAMTVDSIRLDPVPVKESKPIGPDSRAGASPTLRDWISNPRLKEGESRRSILQPPAYSAMNQGKTMLRITATDERGHHLGVWVER
jgi:hypothetical protein